MIYKLYFTYDFTFYHYISIFLGEGNGSPLQYSCLGNPMDRGTWQATIHGVTRVGHDLVTKPPPPPSVFLFKVFWLEW